MNDLSSSSRSNSSSGSGDIRRNSWDNREENALPPMRRSPGKSRSPGGPNRHR